MKYKEKRKKKVLLFHTHKIGLYQIPSPSQPKGKNGDEKKSCTAEARNKTRKNRKKLKYNEFH